MIRRFTDADLAGPPSAVEGTRRLPDRVEYADAPAMPFPSPSTAFDRAPIASGSVVIPEGYEPNYAYPLVVWFHDAGESDRTLDRILPAISERNVLGLALRGERRLPGGGFDWKPEITLKRASRLVEQVRDLRSRYHIHTERIVLAGRGTGAAAATALFLAKPAWFGGLALVDPPADSRPSDLVSSDDLAGKPVLLDLRFDQLGRGRDAASRFGAAGLDVTFRHQRSSDLCAATLRHLNRWLMAAVCRVPVS